MSTESDQSLGVKTAGDTAVIDAGGVYYRDLNERVRAALAAGAATVELQNVTGHRYIGCAMGPGVDSPADGGRIVIRGTPGNDLAAFMNGLEIVVHGNAQDGVGNTMNAGRVIIHGDAGDVLAHSMRGGSILVRGRVGYRAGIHMKSYPGKRPVVIIGGAGNDYLGEYMAGGLLICLGLDRAPGEPVSGIYTGTGMHGGKIILGDDIDPSRLGREVGKAALDDADWAELREYVGEYVCAFGGNVDEILDCRFVKLAPVSRRPYGLIYVY